MSESILLSLKSYIDKIKYSQQHSFHILSVYLLNVHSNKMQPSLEMLRQIAVKLDIYVRNLIVTTKQ